MQLPQLKMTSQQARIGMQHSHAQMRMEQPKAELHLQQPQAKLRISAGKGMLTIDQTQAWEEMNLKSTLRWTESFAAKGRQAANEGTARRAQQGAALTDIHKSVNMIAEQAIANGHPPMRTPTVAYIPSPFAVKVNYQPADITINAYKNDPVIDAQVNRPVIDAIRGNTNIWIEQLADLRIDVAWPVE